MVILNEWTQLLPLPKARTTSITTRTSFKSRIWFGIPKILKLPHLHISLAMRISKPSKIRQSITMNNKGTNLIRRVSHSLNKWVMNTLTSLWPTVNKKGATALKPKPDCSCKKQHLPKGRNQYKMSKAWKGKNGRCLKEASSLKIIFLI